jgi:hypothetical protein
LLFVILAGLLAGPARADRIVLRNLTILSEPVVQFDEDAVRLQSGRTITWDEIESGEVAADKQPAFTSLLKKLGEPTFRIRQKLTTGDYEGLLSFAEEMYPVFAARNSPSAYMVCQSLMWGRLQVGRREEAVEPYLRCLDYLRQHEGKPAGLPGDRRLRLDLSTGLSPELIPIWFDAEAARKALPAARETLREIAKRPQGAPLGTYVLFATLAQAAGEADEAERFLGVVDESVPAVAQLRDIARAQREVEAAASGAAVKKLADNLDRLLPQNKPLAEYWLGLARLSEKEGAARREGVLDLLRLPALYGKQSPELAAAGLFHSMKALEELGDNSGSIALRKELLANYKGTVHANRVKAASAVSVNN